MNSYVLYDGSTVTVYYSKPKKNYIQKSVDIQKKTAESLAKYFAKIENIENDSIVYLGYYLFRSQVCCQHDE